MNIEIEEQEILEGKFGETKKKIIQSVVKYGEIFGASHLAPITHNAHFVFSFRCF